ncbi:MAG: NAD(P)-dependent oxidoreductase [Alphaproteobacteria bacterium]|nr:NAD(P)-dependent oxidoreductase [Alphaproteobacteria bacterium]
MNPTVAVVAQGAMGAGVGGRLAERGLHVVTSLAGRSDASVKRAREAGMVAVSDQECAQADYFLSILPPNEALALAKKMAALIGPSNKKPVYVDCNAVSPPTKIEIGKVIVESGAPFIDVGIIGLPPQNDGSSPWLHASGPDASRFAPIGDFGVNVNVIEGPIGAASALKMSYAGITKGVTALGSMMMLAATRAGAAQGLRNELERGQKTLLPWFQRAIPGMYSKAYRFVGEMDEIADFVGDDPAARKMYEAISEFYTRLAADFEGKQEETGALTEILKPRQ